jgi:alpha-L-fucosidase
MRRRFSKPIAETAGVGNELRLDLPGRSTIDHVVVMEDIARGERVRAYSVEARVAGDKGLKLCEGKSIGHKRIHRFDPVEVAAVRLLVGESTGAPTLRNLAVFNTPA